MVTGCLNIKKLLLDKILYSYYKWIHELQHAVLDQFIPNENKFNEIVKSSNNAKRKMNNQSYDSDDWTKWIQFLQSVNKTGVYNGRDLSRMKHAFSTPGMTFIGVHETLSVGKEFDALLGLTRRGEIYFGEKGNIKKMGNMFDYVNKHIMKDFNEIINRGGSLTPEQKQMFETIQKQEAGRRTRRLMLYT